ncbi:MAG: thiamine-phosphate kinase [Bacteroidales bacterium]|nr:thiamine-phosphate kinase [Bacteroidales bacterium]
MSKKDSDKDIAKIGEFGLIKILTEKIKLQQKSSEYGVGDDAAVLNFNNKKVVVTTDMLTEGVHFDLVYTPLKHLGYKSVIVNLSDIYAMNAHPTQILVSIAVSNKFTTDMIEDIYDGIHLACSHYNVDLVGGDTTSSLTGLTISITAIGEAEEEKITYRNGAKENDLICVSGNLGGAFVGLQLLEREKSVFDKASQAQPDFTGHEYALERQLKPEARKDIVDILKEVNVKPTSMIDISDGLSSELMHICKGSKCGCSIFTEKLPIAKEISDSADSLEIETLTIALNGGEDYELLFTVPLEDHDKLKDLEEISIIGHIKNEKDGAHLVLPDGSLVDLSALGWNSFTEN